MQIIIKYALYKTAALVTEFKVLNICCFTHSLSSKSCSNFMNNFALFQAP